MPGTLPPEPASVSHVLVQGLRTRAGRPLLLIALLVALALMAAPSAHALAPSTCAAADAPLGAAAAGTIESAIGCLVNAERAAQRLAPVRPAPALARAAERHADDMVARRYFAHVSPSGGTLEKRDRRAGYFTAPCWSVGEDLGWAPPALASAEEVVEAWMASPAHRAVILGAEFREIGIAVAGRAPIGDGVGATFVLELGAVIHCDNARPARARSRTRTS